MKDQFSYEPNLDGEPKNTDTEKSVEEMTQKKEEVKQQIIDAIKSSLSFGEKGLNPGFVAANKDLFKGDTKITEEILNTVRDSLFDKTNALVAAEKKLGKDWVDGLKDKYGEDDVALGMMAVQIKDFTSYGFGGISQELADEVDDMIAERMLYCLDNSVLARQDSELFRNANYLAQNIHSHQGPEKAHQFISKVIEDYKKGINDPGSILSSHAGKTYEAALGLQSWYQQQVSEKK